MTKVTIKNKSTAPKPPPRLYVQDIPNHLVFKAKDIRFPTFTGDQGGGIVEAGTDNLVEDSLFVRINDKLLSLRTFDTWELKMAKYYVLGYVPVNEIEITAKY